MKYILITLITLFVSNIFAGNMNDIINQQRLRRDQIVGEISKQNNNFTQYQAAAEQQTQIYKAVVQDIKDGYIKKSQTHKEAKAIPQAIIFVSFSMPNLSLKQAIQDAERYQIPVVMRGLYKNSFRQTLEKLFDLIKEDNKGGISINPAWFKKYNINTVPALVVNNNAQDFNVVYGNIPLKTALTIIVNKGSAAAIAKDILSRGNKCN